MSNEYQCVKAGCDSAAADPRVAGWHMPEPDGDPDNPHDVRALLLCPRCWDACLNIGFFL